jgi:hypothetical protein
MISQFDQLPITVVTVTDSLRADAQSLESELSVKYGRALTLATAAALSADIITGDPGYEAFRRRGTSAIDWVDSY